MFDKKDNGIPSEIDSLESVNGTETDFAEQEFKKYCEANDFDCDKEGMDEDTRKDFEKIEKRFVKAINEKRVVFEGDTMTYTVSGKSKEMAGEKITVRPPHGRTLLAMDGFGKNQQQNQLLAYITAMCNFSRNESNKISSLDRKDYQLLMSVATLFLVE